MKRWTHRPEMSNWGDFGPDDQKGRMIAVMNLTNFIAILLSGAIYMAFDRLIDTMHWPRSVLFAFDGLLILPVALLYRPHVGEK